MKNKQLFNRINTVNRIIHTRNLFVVTPNGSERVIECQISGGIAGVTGLWTGTYYRLDGNTFKDGNGSPVTV